MSSHRQLKSGCLIAYLTRQEAATVDIQRRTMFSMAASALLVLPQVARADISDGTSLPKGAQQFNRVVRLKKGEG